MEGSKEGILGRGLGAARGEPRSSIMQTRPQMTPSSEVTDRIQRLQWEGLHLVELKREESPRSEEEVLEDTYGEVALRKLDGDFPLPKFGKEEKSYRSSWRKADLYW